MKLSGGQRQRIAIARAMLANCPILVLDEATSAIDSESERLVQEALARLMAGRTSIVVLDRGCIVEDGTHEELSVADGIYATLWNYQTGLSK